MSDSFVTSCPHCSTTFKVTSAHLSAANGSVRCGACLKIFNAQAQITQKTTKSPSKSAATRPSNDLGKNFRIPGNNDHPQQGTGFIKSTEIKETAPIKKSPPEVSSQKQEPEFHDDEDNFSFGELSDEMTQIGSDSRFKSNSTERMGHFSANEDESWAEDLLDDFDDEPNLTFEDTAQASGLYQQGFLDGTVAIEPQKSTKEPNLIDQIGTGPLELEFEHPTNVKKSYLWLSGSLLLSLVFCGQLLWFNIDKWSKLDEFRPIYTQLCKLTPCTLAPQIDLAAIRTGNLVVRQNIANPSQLIIDAILINQAPFDQPFTDIILEFSDINGQLIADGQFSPDQYLRGELTGAINMPSKTPIHISFNVKNPGLKAVNYQLRFK